MEEISVLLIPITLGLLLIRLLVLPMKLIWKLALNTASGFACLWLLNTIAPITAVAIPINAVTVLVSGILGLPGITVLALLEMLG